MSSNDDAAWSFTFRNQHGSYDSDSDSEAAGGDDNGRFQSDEARLLQELDLSSREETVVYKPNPFSLAKIAAASRTKRVQPQSPDTGEASTRSQRASTNKIQTVVGSANLAQRAQLRNDSQPQKTGKVVHKNDLTSYMRPKADIVAAKPPAITPKKPIQPQSQPASHNYHNPSVSQIPSVPTITAIQTCRPAPRPTLFSSSVNSRASRPARQPNHFFASSPIKAPRTVTSAKPQSFSSPPMQMVPRLPAYFQSRRPASSRDKSVKTGLNHENLHSSPPSYTHTLNAPVTPVSFPRLPAPVPCPPAKPAAYAPRMPFSPVHARSQSQFQQSPTPPPPAHTQLSSKSKIAHKKRDAYDAFEEEEEWSTLPPKKSKPTIKATQIRTTKFRIPSLFPTSTANAKTPPKSQKKPRVTMFLPPPLVPKSKKAGSNSEPDSYNVEGTTPTPSSKNPEPKYDMRGYPSPADSGVSSTTMPPFPLQTVEEPKKDLQQFAYEPPSPPTSDPLPIPTKEIPAPGSDDAVFGYPAVDVDMDSIRARYPLTRQVMRQRRANESSTINLLGLESCGVVYRDNSNNPTDEIGITEWSFTNPQCYV